MNKTAETLSKFMHRVNLERPILPLKAEVYMYAMHHLQSNKVWLGRTEAPKTMFKKINLAMTPGNSVLDLPKDFRKLLTTSRRIVVYIAGPEPTVKKILTQQLIELGSLIVKETTKSEAVQT